MSDYQLRNLDRDELAAQNALKTMQAKVAGMLTQGQSLSHSVLDDLLNAQATAKVWNRVTHIARVQANLAVDFDAATGTWSVNSDSALADRLATYDHVKELVTERILTRTDFTSRSTSVAANLIDDYERQAEATFVNRSDS